MTDQATGAAPAAPANPIATIKAFLNPQAGPPNADATEGEAETSGIAPADSQAPETDAAPPKEPATRKDEGDEEEIDEAETTEGDEPPEDLQLSSLNDLADATGLELEKLMDLTLPVKVDGKEGTANLRDLLRSYQLDSHLSKKLDAFDSDRKSFESKRAEAEKATRERVEALDKGLAVLSQALEGEFASVDWTKLQNENPAEFNALYVRYQQRFAAMQQIAGQLEAAQKQQKADLEARAKSWLEEQDTLLKAKMPEWSDDKRRTQDRAAIVDYLKGYGISKEEVDSIQDHRVQLVLRDAWRWAELQKQKPTQLKKVKTAPKLLKPGSKQSRESREVVAKKEAQQRLARTGKVRDAVPLLKNILGAPR